jgi:hypothetical protein
VWAPDGVLAAWAQCRGGAGLHTWPEHELIEIVDTTSGLPVVAGGAGEVIWTGTGWYSSALVRLQTGAIGEIVENEVCPACGRRSLRIEETAKPRGLVEILDGSPLVGGWVGELQRVGDDDRLVIWVAPSAAANPYALLAFMGETFPEADVSLADRAELDRRLAAANGERFADRRALAVDAQG